MIFRLHAALTIMLVAFLSGHLTAQETSSPQTDPPTPATEPASETLGTDQNPATEKPATNSGIVIPGAGQFPGGIPKVQTTDSADKVSLPDVETPSSEDSSEKPELPPEYYEELKRRKEVFQKKRVELHEALAEQRVMHIQYLNREKRTKADRDAYYAKRLDVRRFMDELYLTALDVLRIGFEKEEATYVVTLLQNRSDKSYYDFPTLEGAVRMMEGGSKLLFVFQQAARSAVVVGEFDLAKRIFEAVEEDNDAEIDKTLAFNLDRYKESFQREAEIRAREKKEDRLPQVKFETTQGDVIVELYIDQAPTAVSHFIQLVEKGFYDQNDFTQVIDDLFALTGDPSGTGSGNSGQFLVDEHTREDARDAFRGSLVMAKLPIGETGKFVPNSASSQFAILYLPILSVSEEQTVFGRVIQGMGNISYLRRVDPHKKKGKNEVVLPPDRLLRATVIRRPETLPEPVYYQPTQQPTR